MQSLKKCNSTPQSLLDKKHAFEKDCKNNDPWLFYRDNKSKYDYRTSEVKRLLLSASDNRCVICSRSIYDANELKNENNLHAFTIEHIVPKKANPSLIFEWRNMIPCCSLCNNSREDKEYKKELYLNPRERDNFEDFISFSYDGTMYCSSTEFEGQTNYMIDLYNLNGASRRNGIKLERKRYYELLIDDYYQRMVQLNMKFGLSDNIIIFKDMYLFNERNTKDE